MFVTMCCTSICSLLCAVLVNVRYLGETGDKPWAFDTILI